MQALSPSSRDAIYLLLMFIAGLSLSVTLERDERYRVRMALISLAVMALAFLIPAPAHAAQPCDWNAPGAAPYSGRLSAAVEGYPDITSAQKTRLKAKIEAHSYDDVVEITRDTISGEHAYIGLRDMHWLKGMCKGAVSRAKWSDEAKELGLVFCDGDVCLLIPTVCRNVSRVDRMSGGGKPGAEAPAPGEIESMFAEPAGGGISFTKTAPAAFNLDGLIDANPPAAGNSETFWPAPVFATVIGGATVIVIGTPDGPKVPTVTPAVPEPETYLLLMIGLIGIAVARKFGRT